MCARLHCPMNHGLLHLFGVVVAPTTPGTPPQQDQPVQSLAVLDCSHATCHPVQTAATLQLPPHMPSCPNAAAHLDCLHTCHPVQTTATLQLPRHVSYCLICCRTSRLPPHLPSCPNYCYSSTASSRVLLSILLPHISTASTLAILSKLLLLFNCLFTCLTV